MRCISDHVNNTSIYFLWLVPLDLLLGWVCSSSLPSSSSLFSPFLSVTRLCLSVITSTKRDGQSSNGAMRMFVARRGSQSVQERLFVFLFFLLGPAISGTQMQGFLMQFTGIMYSSMFLSVLESAMSSFFTSLIAQWKSTDPDTG